jgi:di/tricarboxylate transporter
VGEHFGGLGPSVVLGALLLVTVLITQLVDNAAVAIVLAPVAYELALASDAEPATFLTAVAICASSAFMTPIAHESTILVMGAGGYRFTDYLKLGTPFSALTWLITWVSTVAIGGLL